MPTKILNRIMPILYLLNKYESNDGTKKNVPNPINQYDNGSIFHSKFNRYVSLF